MSDEKITEDQIISRITDLYPGAAIDVAGEDCSFEVFVVSDQFNDMNTLQRQKSILALFKNEITSGKLHALSVKAKTEQELSANAGLVQIKL